jgi:hypothetical protein
LIAVGLPFHLLHHYSPRVLFELDIFCRRGLAAFGITGMAECTSNYRDIAVTPELPSYLCLRSYKQVCVHVPSGFLHPGTVGFVGG